MKSKHIYRLFKISIILSAFLAIIQILFNKFENYWPYILTPLFFICIFIVNLFCKCKYIICKCKYINKKTNDEATKANNKITSNETTNNETTNDEATKANNKTTVDIKIDVTEKIKIVKL